MVYKKTCRRKVDSKGRIELPSEFISKLRENEVFFRYYHETGELQITPFEYVREMRRKFREAIENELFDYYLLRRGASEKGSKMASCFIQAHKRVVLPDNIVEQSGFVPGDLLEYRVEQDRLLLKKVTSPAAQGTSSC